MASHENHHADDLDQQRSHVASAVSVGTHAVTAAGRDRGDTEGTRNSASRGLPVQFGRYRVKKQLGAGGMGTVYLVENTELEREEALKVPKFTDGDDSQLRARFLREAKSAARLEHANLCPIYDAGVQDGIYYLTMRFLKGRLLSDYTGTPQPQRSVVEIVAQLAVAMEAAHEREVIHRDLKPGNIMMVDGVGPVVMDFGLAKTVPQADTLLTQAGSMLGTPAYMPPEQVNGDLERIGPASDIYSLGVILYQLLTGRLPFQGTTASIFGQILYTEPPLPSVLTPGLNPALDAICQKAMAKAPTDRYPSMQAFAAALTDFLRSTSAIDTGGNLMLNKVDETAIYPAPAAAGPLPGGAPTQPLKTTLVARPRLGSRQLVIIGIACALIAIGSWAVVAKLQPHRSTTGSQATLAADPASDSGDPATVVPDEGSIPGDVRDDNALKLKLCWCPTGTTPGFWIGEHEVTQSQWARLMGSMPSELLEKGKGDRYPIYRVTHSEALEFCRKLTDLERSAGRLPLGWEYRLPTEVQWEYACRAGTTTETAFGDSLSSTQANFNGDWPHNGGEKGPSHARALEVGLYRPNAWGIYDMHGNVGEFIERAGVIRGGSWCDNGRNCCSEIFIPVPPDARSESVGFRVTRVPTPLIQMVK